MYMIAEFILLCIFFFARSATRSRSFQLHPVYDIYVCARCSILDSKKEAHKYAIITA